MNDHTQVRQFIQVREVAARLIGPKTPMPTVPMAAAALGVTESQIVKTIVFEGKKSSECVAVAIVTGDARVDRGRVAAELGLPTLKLASSTTVSTVIGYEVGGVPPVAHATSVPIVVDRAVFAHSLVYGGGGDEFHMLEITPAEILRLTGARVADVTMAAISPSQSLS